MDHPAVQQVITFAMPHDKLGEDVAAAIVLREGLNATEKELREFVGQRVADFKVPRKIIYSRMKFPRARRGNYSALDWRRSWDWLNAIEPEAASCLASGVVCLKSRINTGVWRRVHLCTKKLSSAGMHPKFLLDANKLQRIGCGLTVDVTYLRVVTRADH